MTNEERPKANQIREYIEGVVDKVSPKQIKLTGEDTRWKSNYAEPGAIDENAATNDQVRLGLDSTGRVRSLEIITATGKKAPATAQNVTDMIRCSALRAAADLTVALVNAGILKETAEVEDALTHLATLARGLITE